MSWTTPRTWTVGEVITAAELNEQVRDNLLYLFAGGAGGADACRVHSLADHTLAHNSWDAIAYNATRFDVNGNMAGGSGSTGLSIATPGIFIFIAQARFGASTAGVRGLRLINPDNGNTIAQTIEDGETSGSTASEVVLSTIWNATIAGVKFHVEAFQDSGSALNVVYAPDHSFEFMAVRIA